MPDIFKFRLQNTRDVRGMPGPRASLAKSSSGRASCWVFGGGGASLDVLFTQFQSSSLEAMLAQEEVEIGIAKL